MDLQRLRQETATDHDRTEAAVPLMADGLTRERYAGTLGRIYGFIRGWELWADAHCPEDLAAPLAERQRSGLIAQDLQWLGHAVPQAVATLPDGPVTRAGFLGRMYVVEGSTLGGQYLAAHMEQVFGLRRGEGNAYFVGYGTRTGSMWNGFRGLLAALPEADAEEVVSGAKAMFAAFEGWMLAGENGPDRTRTESEHIAHA